MTSEITTYKRSVDEKGRVYVSVLRQYGDLVLTPSFVFGDSRNNYLLGFQRSEFKKRADNLIEKCSKGGSYIPLLPPLAIRRMTRHLHGNSVECSIDTWGRITIPKSLGQYIGMPTSVIIEVDEGNKTFKIWNEKEYKRSSS